MKHSKVAVKDAKKLVCGIVMPISAIDGCTDAHWADVLEILSEAVDGAGFEPNVVSNAEDVGLIHKRIIQNLYDNPIVVCDVSGKNPNVMFELGLRLAFDKPTIILKDDKTSYSFDTAAIEHLDYPRDLRFSMIVDFKQKLSEKISATHKKATSDSSYTTFLKHFGEFTVAKLDKKEISGQEFILEELRNLRVGMRRLEGARIDPRRYERHRMDSEINVCAEGVNHEDLEKLINAAIDIKEVRAVMVRPHRDHTHLWVTTSVGASQKLIETEIESIVRRYRRDREQASVKKQLDNSVLSSGGRSSPPNRKRDR